MFSFLSHNYITLIWDFCRLIQCLSRRHTKSNGTLGKDGNRGQIRVWQPHPRDPLSPFPHEGITVGSLPPSKLLWDPGPVRLQTAHSMVLLHGWC